MARVEETTGGGRSVPGALARLGSAYVSGQAGFALLLLLWGAFMLNTGFGLDIRDAHDPLGGRFFPLLNSALLIVATVAVLLSPLARLLIGQRPSLGETVHAAGDEDAEELRRLPRWQQAPLGRVTAAVVVCAGYLVLMELITYIPATILAMAAMLYLLGSRGLVRLTVGPVTGAIVLYLVFTYGLFVRLP